MQRFEWSQLPDLYSSRSLKIYHTWSLRRAGAEKELLIMGRRMIRFSAAEQSLLDELKAYQKEGCGIYLNGRASYPNEVVNACFREEGGYMRDLVGDENAVIRRIDFIRIRNSK